MNGNIYNEEEQTLNKYNIYPNIETDNFDLNNCRGIYSENSDDKNKSNSDLSQENYEYLIPNEDIIPYSPEMSEEPIHPNQRKQIITNNIINNKIEHNNEDIFTFKNNNNKLDNSNFNGNDTFKPNNTIVKLDNLYDIDTKDNNLNLNKIKANVLNFEDVINQRNNEILNNSKNDYNFSLCNSNKDNKINPKSDINRKLNQSKKNSKKSLKNNKGTNGKNNNLKNISKSSKKQNDKIKLFENKSMDAIEFENFMKNTKSSLIGNKTRTKVKNKNGIKNSKEKINIKIDKDKIIINTNKSIENEKYINNKIKRYKNNNDVSKRNIYNNNTEIFSKITCDEILKSNKNNAKKLDIKKKNENIFRIPSDISDNHSYYQNDIISSKRDSKKSKSKRNSNIRDFRKVEDTGVSLDVTVDEISMALKNKDIGKNIKKRFIPMKENLINYDNSKFDKYDTEQIRYELMKDFSNIRPDIADGFLQRMQFDSLKRINKAEMLNQFVERSKYKKKEAERKKAFNRLSKDANRRINEKKQKEVMEEENNLIREYLGDDKKYNEREWNKIYQKRFKDYEDCKKKKVEVEIQKKKIQKMIEEEEEINMCNVKKLPENKIIENSQRLFDEAKKRMMIKNRRLKEKNRDSIYLTTFNDEEDVSKYMKNFRNETYNFNGNNENNSYLYNNSKYFYNMNNNFNGGFDNKSSDKKSVFTRYKKKNGPTFDNNRIKRNLKKNKNNIYYPINNGKNDFNNISFDNGNNFIRYSKFKQNKLDNLQPINYFNNNYSKNFHDDYSCYNFNNNINNTYINNVNENLENENNNYQRENITDNYQQGNIIDNFLYGYCINKYFDKNSKKGVGV